METVHKEITPPQSHLTDNPKFWNKTKIFLKLIEKNTFSAPVKKSTFPPLSWVLLIKCVVGPSEPSSVSSGMPFIPVFRYTVKSYARFPGFPLKTARNTGIPGDIQYPYNVYTDINGIRYSFTVGYSKAKPTLEFWEVQGISRVS